MSNIFYNTKVLTNDWFSQYIVLSAQAKTPLEFLFLETGSLSQAGEWVNLSKR